MIRESTALGSEMNKSDSEQAEQDQRKVRKLDESEGERMQDLINFGVGGLGQRMAMKTSKPGRTLTHQGDFNGRIPSNRFWRRMIEPPTLFRQLSQTAHRSSGLWS